MAMKKARVSFKSLASEEGDEKLIITVLSTIPLLSFLSYTDLYTAYGHRSSIRELLNNN